MSDAVGVEITLDAPAERVWDVVMDPQRLGDWVTTHAGLGDDTPKRLEQGSRFEQKLNVSGAKFEVTWTVTECERNSSVQWEGEGPGGSRAVVGYRLEPEGEGTRFRYENRYELPGGVLGRLAGRAVGDRVARREAERTLENLKQLVEGSAQARGSLP